MSQILELLSFFVLFFFFNDLQVRALSFLNDVYLGTTVSLSHHCPIHAGFPCICKPHTCPHVYMYRSHSSLSHRSNVKGSLSGPARRALGSSSHFLSHLKNAV